MLPILTICAIIKLLNKKNKTAHIKPDRNADFCAESRKFKTHILLSLHILNKKANFEKNTNFHENIG